MEKRVLKRLARLVKRRQSGKDGCCGNGDLHTVDQEIDSQQTWRTKSVRVREGVRV